MLSTLAGAGGLQAGAAGAAQKAGGWLFPDGRDCLHQGPASWAPSPSAPLTEILFFRQLDILCNEEILGKDHTLKFVVSPRGEIQGETLL